MKHFISPAPTENPFRLCIAMVRRQEEGVGIYPFQLKKERYIPILLNSYVQPAEITKDKKK